MVEMGIRTCSRHVFHSIVILQLGTALLDVFVTLASPFLRLYQSALNSVEVFAYGAGVLGGPRQLLP